MPEKVLVIKHGAFGDFVQATGAFRAIYEHYHNNSDAEITLLTCAPYDNIAKDIPWFNHVVIDFKPKIWQLAKIFSLRQWFIKKNFDAVYDLQNSDRTAFYFKMLWPFRTKKWSGFVRGCTHPHRTPSRTKVHTIERLAEQLQLANITQLYPPSVEWANNPSITLPPSPFAVIVAGGSAHRADKRWPVENYIDVAKYLCHLGITPVLIGTKIDADINQAIKNAIPQAINMTDQTNFHDIVALGKAAEWAIGNDTGPLHLLSVSGAKTISLFSFASDPVRCAQRGISVKIFRANDLNELPSNDIISYINSSLG